MRRTNSNYLNSKLSKISFIETPKFQKDQIHNCMMYTIRVKGGQKRRDALQKFMTKKGIQTSVIFEPIHLTQFYRKKFGYKKGLLKNTEKISDEVLTLPMFPHLKKSELNYISDSIGEFSEKI